MKDLHYFARPSEAQGFKYYNFVMLRYIGYLTFALDYMIHGFSVARYHVVNIAIHIANAILVYLFVLLTFRTPFFKNVNGENVNSELNPDKKNFPPIHDSPFTIHVLFNDSRSSIAFFSSLLFAVTLFRQRQ